MDPQLSPVNRTSTRWAGRRAPMLASLVIVFGVIVGLRAFASGPAATPGTGAASPSRVPGGESSPQVSSPGPVAVGQPRLITPKVERVGALDELKPLQAASFPLGDLVSVSPDGRYALVWTATPDMIRASTADIVAIPFADGDDDLQLEQDHRGYPLQPC